MQATVQLQQHSGVQGPRATIEVVEDWDEQREAIREWAFAQVGHPWEAITVELSDGTAYDMEL